jgi:hypothetical protein
MATAPQRLLMTLSVALLVAGLIGAATHGSGHRHPATATRPTGPATAPRSTTATRPATRTSTAPGRPGPGAAALEAGLVTPTDMGGYYRVTPTAAASLLDSAPCLAALQPSPVQSGRAATALLGPDSHSVPTIVEEVASYPSTSSRSVYRSVAASLDSCPSLSFDFAGTTVTSRLARSSIPPVGDADQVWAGTFADPGAGASFTVQVGAVLDGPDVLAVIWIDTVAPSPAIMGTFTSTLSLAIGKLA